MQMVRSYFSKGLKDWYEHLPLMSMALHSMKNMSTGFSANTLMFGRGVIQPIDLMLGVNRQTAQDLPTWVKTLSHNLSEAQLDGIRLAELKCAKEGLWPQSPSNIL